MDWLDSSFIFLSASVPLVLATLGLMVQEKAGVLNLGVQGLVALGAFSAFAATYDSGSYLLGYVMGGLVAAAIAAGFALLIVVMKVNPYLAGLSLWLLGTGMAAVLSLPYLGLHLPAYPFANESAVWRDPMLFMTVLFLLGVHVVFLHTRLGLITRAIGHFSEAMLTLGHDVLGVRFSAMIVGGFFCGLAGAHLSLMGHLIPGTISNEIWLAIGLCFVATWRVWAIVPVVLVVKGLLILVPAILGHWFEISVAQWDQMMPFLILLIIFSTVAWAKHWIHRPQDLGA